MVNIEKKNQTVSVWDFPYISFVDALKIAEQMKRLGGVATPEKLAKAMSVKQTGWFGLQVASLRRWGLVEGRGELHLSDYYQRIVGPRSQGDDVKAKQEVFMNIPLFKSIFDKYIKHGLPQDPYFQNTLESEYGLKGRNPTLVASLIREFMQEYFPSYGSMMEEIRVNESNRGLNLDSNSPPVRSTSPSVVNAPIVISIISPVGNFNLTAKNKSEFESLIKDKIDKVWEAIKILWKEDLSEIEHTRKSGENFTSSGEEI